MDTNLFPVILVILTLVTGLIWALDIVYLRQRRQVAVANATSGGSGVTTNSADVAKEEAAEPVIVEYAKSFFPVLAIVLVLRSFVVEPFQIPSASMEPTLVEGDFILVNKFHYGLRLPVIGTKILPINDPKRGDVMVFIPPHDPRYFIKRVVGLPGDVIVYQNKRLFVNGDEMDMSLVAALPAINPEREIYDETLGEVTHKVQLLQRNSQEGTWTVPEGHYFMLGDNRDNSGDSRMWGYVPDHNIVGKAFAIWTHWPSITSVPSFKRNGFIE